MTYLSSKMWSDKARAAALAKRRGQAAPADTPQQSHTAAEAVAHANALIAAGKTGGKPKKGKAAGGKGKGAGKAPKAAKPTGTPQEKANQNRAQVAKQTGMGDLEGTVTRLGAGMHSDLEKAAHDKLIDKGLAQRAADGTVTLSAAGKKWKAAADKGDNSAAQGALAEAQAGKANAQAKEKAHGDKQAARTAATAERAQVQKAKVAERAKVAVDKAKAAKDKAKAGGGGSSSKPKAAASKPAQSAADHQAAIDKTNASANARNATAQSRLDKAKANEIAPELSAAAGALATGAKPDRAQEAALIGKGLAKRSKTGALQLTARGQQVAQQRTQKGLAMQIKAADIIALSTALDALKRGARNSRTDQQMVDTIAQHAHALGGHCPDCPADTSDPTAKAIGDIAPMDTSAPAMDASAPMPTDPSATPDDEMSEDEGVATVSITLPVPADIAAELAISGGMDAATLALELLDLGDLDALSSQKFAILAAVEQVIQSYSTIDADVSAVGRAITPDADGMTPFYVAVTSPDLDTLRSALLEALQQFGIDADADAFVPRIELQDIGPDDPTPTDMPTVTSITFDTLCVNFAGSPVMFPLGDPAADEAALEDAQDGGADDATEQPSGAPLAKSVGDETLVNFGGAVKSLSNGHIGGYLVRFSTAADPDLTGDYFTKDTDYGFGPGDTLKTAVYFNHRLPMKTRDGGVYTVKEKIGTGTLSMDDTGVFIDAVLYNRERYEATLSSQGWSSGTASHLVDREPSGKSMYVKSWQLGLDASITPTPAEPRTRVLSLKSFLAETQPEARLQTARSAVTGSAANDSHALPFIILRRKA